MKAGHSKQKLTIEQLCVDENRLYFFYFLLSGGPAITFLMNSATKYAQTAFNSRS